jgi:hypothetical protein
MNEWQVPGSGKTAPNDRLWVLAALMNTVSMNALRSRNSV